ncbi:hypothetical protein [Winogradskyella ludwigii]|uniref:hypothetical protein n=1 Tax=Winogradskyella ludwigii TaxID=2686076 RepID=UPI0015CC917A|nr:hypothetical protein [Winogradskyella ludwigii]
MNKTKQVILGMLLVMTTGLQAQNGFFDNISEEDQYHGYLEMSESENGFFKAKSRNAVVKFKIDYLPTGEGYKLEATVDEGTDIGKTYFSIDASGKGNSCVGYPYESVLSKKQGQLSYISIDNYVFFVEGLSKDKTSFKSLLEVYIKVGSKSEKEKTKNKKKPKKKNSFMAKMKALKNQAKAAAGNFGPEYKEFETKNIREMITNYLVAMKAKQEGRTAKQKQSDNNVANIEVVRKAARDAERAEAKRYNDSVMATPEWKDLERRKKQNEANYQSRQKVDVVTLRNTSGSTIYVARSGSKNRGTKISAGGSASWSCGQDAYIQVNGTTTNTKVYSSNSGCGDTVTVR